MPHRRPLNLALAGLLCVAAVGGLDAAAPQPVRAAVPANSPEFKDLREFLGKLGFTDEAIAEIAASTDADKLSDWFDSALQTPAIRAASSDIIQTSFFEIHTTMEKAAEWRAAGGPLDCDTLGVICPQMPANGPWGPDFVAYAITTAVPPAPFAGGRIEMGAAVLFELAAGGAPPPWVALPQFPGDFFDGFNEAYTFRSDNGAPFAGIKFVHDPATKAFVDRPTDAVAALQGRTTIAIIPETDTGLLVSGRFFGFTGAAGGNAIDTFPDIDQPAKSYAGIPRIELGLAVASPSASAASSASTTPSSAVVAPSASARASSAPASAPTSGGGSLPLLWVLLIAIGLGFLLMGLWFLFWRGRTVVAGASGASVGGGAVAVGGVSDDPCPPLIAAAKAAQAACEEAILASTAAADAARARAAEAEAARLALDKARAAREAAEQELEKRRQPPDPGQRLGSTSYGGRDVHVDEYDLWLQEQARAAANAAHKAAVDAATTDAERQQAHDDWVDELQRVDGADGLDEVRRRDKDGRERWIKEAEATLEAAQDAESAAEAEATRTAEAAQAAAAEAAAAKQRADDACARAEVAAAEAADCIKLQTPVVPVGEGGEPEGQGGTPPPPPPPPAPPQGPPPTPPTSSRPCPDGSEPRITTSGAFEVELFVLSSAQLRIDGAFLFSDDEAGAAIEGLETATAASDVAVGLIGAVTDPVGSILGSLGVPSFDTVTSAPTGAAIKALNKLKEQLREKRKIGTWTLRVPRQRFRFSCRITESCVGGQWVVTGRDFVGERIGTPSHVDSAPYELVDVRETDHAWAIMSTPFIRQNRVAEQMIASAARTCGG